MTFAGFPARAEATAIPNVFFSELLPQLAADPAAAGVALYAFRAILRQKGSPRFITAADMAHDAALASYLANAGVAGDGVYDGSLARIAELGVLLPLTVEREGQRTVSYFLNTPADRRGMESVRRGDVDIGALVREGVAPSTRSTVFALYESLVGTVSPLIADELADAERLYPYEWLEEAFREAAAQNARSWRYVSRILERWASEGRGNAKAERDPAGDGRYFAGKYGRILKQRLRP